MKKKGVLERIAETILILILIVLIVCMMIDVRNLQGNARVINYAGIVRGATQRLVKMEIAGEERDDLEDYLDQIYEGLRHGGGEFALTKLDDTAYLMKLEELHDYWGRLKEEIQKVRKQGYEQTNIIDMSETYFQMADETVTAAEDCSQTYASRISLLEKMLVAVIVGIVILLIKQSADALTLMKNNKELKKKAYIDLHTGLPNKSKCEELMLDRTELANPTSVAIFDLNGLKAVNDTLGHVAGDSLILNFANILRTAIPENYFVGRYGGDEFIAVFPELEEEQVVSILNSVQEGVDRYNLYSKQMHMEYAVGYAISTAYRNSNLKILLERADQKMYQRKAKMKKEHKTSECMENQGICKNGSAGEQYVTNTDKKTTKK